MATAVREGQESLVADLVEEIEHLVEDGDTTSEAAEKVQQRVLRDGLAEAFVQEFGRQALMYLYRHRANGARQRAFSPPGKPLTNVDSLNRALMKKRFSISGGYRMPLEDCEKPDVHFIRDDYRVHSVASEKKAQFFESIEERLKGQQTVKDVWTEEELQALWRDIVGEDPSKPA